MMGFTYEKRILHDILIYSIHTLNMFKADIIVFIEYLKYFQINLT